MPKIQGYENQIGAQGSLNVQANPASFGAGLAEGMQHLSAGLGDVGNAVYQQVEAQNVTDIHTRFAVAREQWTQTFQDRLNQASPGDDTFAPALTQDMNDALSQGSDIAKTPTARRLYQSLSASMVSEFGQRAITAQAQLAGTAARNQTVELMRASGDTAFRDFTQRDAIQASIEATFNDPKSIYAKIPAPHREALLAEAKNAVDHATVRGIARDHPEWLLGAVAPEQLNQFKPWDNLIKTYLSPGGKINVSDATMKEAPTFANVSAVRGLNPNILMAQADQKPGVAPAKLAEDMSKLVDRYSGDYAKAVAAYQVGPDQLDLSLRANGSNWELALPPDTRAYVDGVMQNSGARPTTAPSIVTPTPETGATITQLAPAPATSTVPVRNSALPAFNGLTWEQQDQAINESVRLQHLRMTMAQHARMESEHQLEKQQENVFNGYISRIYDPANNGGSLGVHEVANNDTLKGHQKNQLVQIMFQYQRELKTAAETKSNPVLTNALQREMIVADNDPTQAPSMDHALAELAAGRIYSQDYMRIQGTYVGLKDQNGNSYTHQMSAHIQAARRDFLAMPSFILNPEGAEQATARLQGDLQDKTQEMRKAGKNPRSLLDPSSPDYFFKPGTLNSYAVGSKAALVDKAGATVGVEKSKVAPGTIKGGYQFKGGDPGKKENWMKVDNTSGATNPEGNF